MLFVVRHAKAHDRDHHAWPDDSQRPLTKSGARRFATLARTLATRYEPPSIVLASSYERAWHTAKILEAEAGWPAPAPGRPLECDEDASVHEIGRWLRDTVGEAESAAIVGHEPLLSEVVSELMGCHGPGVTMSKGAIAVLNLRDRAALLGPGDSQGGAAELLALVDPRWVAE